MKIAKTATGCQHLHWSTPSLEEGDNLEILKTEIALSYLTCSREVLGNLGQVSSLD